jgi:hypothetical protein
MIIDKSNNFFLTQRNLDNQKNNNPRMWITNSFFFFFFLYGDILNQFGSIIINLLNLRPRSRDRDNPLKSKSKPTQNM